MSNKTIRSPFEPYCSIYGDVTIPEGITLRLARPGDLASIEELSMEADLLGGRDYMVDMFHEFLQDPQMIMAVVEIDGKVVALGAFTLEPNGDVASGYAGRTSIHHRSEGLLIPLLIYGDCLLHQRAPGLKKQYGMTTYIKYWTEWPKLHTNADYKNLMIMTQHPLAHKQPIDVIRSALIRSATGDVVSTRELNAVTRTDRHELRELLKNDDIKQTLFPHNVINLAIQPFTAKPSNTDFFINSLRMPVYIGRSNSEISSISFGIIYQCPIGMRYDIAYYSSHGDITVAMVHILHHLGNLVAQHHRYRGNVTAQINYREGLLDTRYLQKVLASIGLDGGNHETSPLLVHEFGKSKL